MRDLHEGGGHQAAVMDRGPVGGFRRQNQRWARENHHFGAGARQIGLVPGFFYDETAPNGHPHRLEGAAGFGGQEGRPGFGHLAGTGGAVGGENNALALSQGVF